MTGMTFGEMIQFWIAQMLVSFGAFVALFAIIIGGYLALFWFAVWRSKKRKKL